MELHRKVGMLLCGVAISACGGNGGSAGQPEKAPQVKIKVTLDNQSQFELEKLLIHASINDYDLSTNILTKPLAVGQQWRTEVMSQTWFVTVLRKPNADAAPLAYTTARSWDPQRYPRLIYFDEQFRGAAADDSRPAAND